MKRVVLLALLALALPMAAWADSTDGSFAITDNGTKGSPSGVLFSGTFTNISWGKVGSHNFVLSGTWSNGAHVEGGTRDLALKGKGFELSSDDTSLSVPEPGTLGLLGTGLVGIAGLIRRRSSLRQ